MEVGKLPDKPCAARPYVCPMPARRTWPFVLLALVVLVLFVVQLFVGSVDVPLGVVLGALPTGRPGNEH